MLPKPFPPPGGAFTGKESNMLKRCDIAWRKVLIAALVTYGASMTGTGDVIEY
jgi:hypothetical protein